ncbi:CAP domain-containing protein [Aquisalibacillus elongatus]|uniref:Putative YkwD family protein n=1 Tax=Aquisalibacillus elongatus TaxID=485577 RepID=A0A3N5B4Q0_9BACI|nr:CAP domain-containing protein [Aquisalibacillus elongatus]RPF52257.1 putative YkwD family protein [Aquisalibacillus elongatus]
MAAKLKWIFGIMLLSVLLTGCNMEGGAENNGDQDLEQVGFGAGDNQGTDGQYGAENRNNNPFINDNGTNDNNNFWNNDDDRGFNFNNRYNEVEPNRDGNQNNNQNRNENRNGSQTNEQTQNNQSAPNDMIEEVVRLTNQERTKNGLSELKIDQELNNVAQTKSVDMADNGYFSHQSPTYGSPFEMLDQFGVDYTVAAENIAAGQKSPEQVVKQWMNSEGHRKNILNDSVTHIGIGYEPSGNMSPYWTQMFIAK